MKWYGWAILSLLGWGVWGMLAGAAADRGTAFGLAAGAAVAEALVLAFAWPQVAQAASWSVFGMGVASALAYVALFLAVQSGPTGAVIAVTSLYPIVTGVLAWIVLGEVLSWRQMVGLVLGVVAVTLMMDG